MSRPDALKVGDGIDKESSIAFVRAAIGMPDVNVTIGDIATWRAVAEVAERFTEGRVFLVGDAAHVMPPMGGFGGNTGVQDTHNLAWKLALVLKGVAGRELLATYNTERQPVGELAIQQAYTRYVLRVVPERGREGMQPIVNDLNMEIGYGYRSPAIIAEPGNEAPLHGDPHRSKGMPGTRAPHVMIERAGKPISTFDLFTKNFCILAAPDGGAWCEAARAAAAQLGLPLDAHHLDHGELRDPQRRFVEAYGLSPAGAVLIRPDGFVGWRAVDPAGASAAAMHKALASLLCRNGT